MDQLGAFIPAAPQRVIVIADAEFAKIVLSGRNDFVGFERLCSNTVSSRWASTVWGKTATRLDTTSSAFVRMKSSYFPFHPHAVGLARMCSGTGGGYVMVGSPH